MGARAQPIRTRQRPGRTNSARYRGGAAQPTVLDLFSGCGGLTQGFVDAGYAPVGGIELDSDAIQSYANNFHGGDPRYSKTFDITRESPEAVLNALNVTRDQIDTIVGGPPCPAFANIGRAKLAQVNDNDPDAYLKDPRAQLWRQYLEWVDYIQPRVLLMENVPGILNWGNANVGDQICEVLETKGYLPVYALLNSANYGVPQSRIRFFLVAVHTDVGTQKYRFPEQTHAGTNSADSAGQGALRQAKLPEHPDYRRFAGRCREPEQPISTHDALDDLPGIDASARSYKRDNTPLAPYRDVILHPYAAAMRKGMRGKPPQQHTTHTRVVTDRDRPIFKQMKQGDTYPAALIVARKEFEKASAKDPTAEERDFVPPYAEDKYKDKWWKLEAHRPSKTVMAHLAKDGYSHIHYRQPRMLSVREAARLQSFPDRFIFQGSMTSAFRQIGNAVPPRMAQTLATQILKILKQGP